MSITTVGIVVNPKLQTPVFVAWDEADIQIWSLAPNGQLIGYGSYEKDDPQYLAPSYVTGLPRVHTPGGVSPKGKGYGTTLYTGLCLGAHLNTEDQLELFLDYDGDGISSEADTRSASAQSWWSRAKRLGLAVEIEEEHVEEDVEFSASELSDCVDDDGNDVDLSWARGDVSKMVSADIYTFDKAENADLVVASFTVELTERSFVNRTYDAEGKPTRYLRAPALRHMWKQLDQDDDLVEEVEIDPLLALDVRNLEPQAINLLSWLARYGGASDEDIDLMRVRAEFGLDPSVPQKQQRLPFKPNAAQADLIEESLSETRALRKDLDWKRLSSLP